MANLAEQPAWQDVYQLEPTDPVQGGADGFSNKPLKNLANRTAWLRGLVKAVCDSQNVSLVNDQTSQLLTAVMGIAQQAAQNAAPNLNLGNAVLSGTNYTASTTPSGSIPAIFTIKFTSNQPANPTLTVSTTTAPMVDSDGTAIAGIAANERRTVQWDGINFVVSESDSALSSAELAQVQALIAAAGGGGGTLKKLSMSATGASALVAVSADEVAVKDAAGSGKSLSAVSLSINTANAGANGLDTGTLAASTWYAVWVIYNPTTQVAAGLVSLSATAPTMPSGYTMKDRVGWIRTDGTANKYPLSVKQFGRRAQYISGTGNVPNLPLMASGVLGSNAGSNPPTWAAVATGNFVPPTAVRVDISTLANTNTVIAIGSNPTQGGVNSTSNPPPLSLQTYPNGFVSMLLESINIYAVSSGSCVVACIGWEDNL